MFIRSNTAQKMNWKIHVTATGFVPGTTSIVNEHSANIKYAAMIYFEGKTILQA